jgi:hypothetical protein
MDHIIVRHIVRRGMEAHSAFHANMGGGNTEPAIELPLWTRVLLACTALLFVISLSMVGGLTMRLQKWLLTTVI